jgi:hypothetical protein
MNDIGKGPSKRGDLKGMNEINVGRILSAATKNEPDRKTKNRDQRIFYRYRLSDTGQRLDFGRRSAPGLHRALLRAVSEWWKGKVGALVCCFRSLCATALRVLGMVYLVVV